MESVGGSEPQLGRVLTARPSRGLSVNLGCFVWQMRIATRVKNNDVYEVPQPVPGTRACSASATPGAWTGSRALARGRGRPRGQSWPW